MSVKVRITADQIAHNSKIEVRVGDEWIDISGVCTGFQVSGRVGDITRASVDVVHVEVAEGRQPMLLDAGSLARLATVIDDARAAGVIPPAGAGE